MFLPQGQSCLQRWHNYRDFHKSCIGCNNSRPIVRGKKLLKAKMLKRMKEQILQHHKKELWKNLKEALVSVVSNTINLNDKGLLQKGMVILWLSWGRTKVLIAFLMHSIVFNTASRLYIYYRKRGWLVTFKARKAIPQFTIPTIVQISDICSNFNLCRDGGFKIRSISSCNFVLYCSLKISVCDKSDLKFSSDPW